MFYQPPRCKHASCSNNGCCSIFGFCVDPETPDLALKQLCYIENGCQSEFWTCYDGNCNHKDSINKWSGDECCSVDGYCIHRYQNEYSSNSSLCFIENGCVSEFSGHRWSADLEKIEEYSEKEQETILYYNCEKEIEPFISCMCYEYSFDEDDCK